jgi:hypothetical protein
MKILGISGYARSGKDTAALALIEEGWRRIALADALKREVLAMLAVHGVTPDLNDPATKEQLRPLLVFWGAFRRKQDPDYWIMQMPGKNCLVVPDIRYLNECNWILGLGGNLLYISRPGVEPANDEEIYSFSALHDAIPSWGDDRFRAIGNDGKISTLRNRVRAVMRDWGWLS